MSIADFVRKILKDNIQGITRGDIRYDYLYSTSFPSNGTLLTAYP